MNPDVGKFIDIKPLRRTVVKEIQKWISYEYSDKEVVRSDRSKPALIFFFTARVHITKSTSEI
jgi:hypothetical protein